MAAASKRQAAASYDRVKGYPGGMPPPSPAAPLAPQLKLPQTEGTPPIDWSRLSTGKYVQPGALDVTRDYVMQALENPSHPQHEDVVQHLRQDPKLAVTLGFTISPQMARRFGVSPTGAQGPLQFAKPFDQGAKPAAPSIQERERPSAGANAGAPLDIYSKTGGRTYRGPQGQTVTTPSEEDISGVEAWRRDIAQAGKGGPLDKLLAPLTGTAQQLAKQYPDVAQAASDLQTLLLGPAYGTELGSSGFADDVINQALRFTAGLNTPGSIATMVAGAGVANRIGELLAMPQFAYKLAQYPRLRAGLEAAGRGAVPAGFAIQSSASAYQNITEGVRTGNQDQILQGIIDTGFAILMGSHVYAEAVNIAHDRLQAANPNGDPIATARQTLGVDEDASFADVKSAYREYANQWHPDKPGGSNEKMADGAAAFAVLDKHYKQGQPTYEERLAAEQKQAQAAQAAGQAWPQAPRGLPPPVGEQPQQEPSTETPAEAPRRGFRSGTAAAGVPGATYHPIIPPQVNLSGGAAPEAPTPAPTPKVEVPPPVGAPPSEVVPAPPQQEGKPLWEMTRDEIEQAHQETRAKDQQDLVEIFGENGAKRYQQLTRIANGTSDKADAAANSLSQMEMTLTEEQRRRLYGQDQPPGAPNLEEIQDYRRALGGLDPTSAADLGASLKWAITRVGYDPDPANMNADQRVAYATIREAYRIAHEQGFDPAEVSRAALTAAWGRYPDPEDAEYMLQHFLTPAQQKVQEGKQEPPQAALPPPVGQAGPPPAPPSATIPPPVGTIGPDGQDVSTEPGGESGEGTAPPATHPPVSGVPSGQSTTTLLIPGTRIRLQGRYRVRPLSELISSHHGFSFQPNRNYRYVNERDYTKQEPQSRVMEQAHEFEPLYMINNNPDNVNGPPIVDPEGHAFGGNSRLMTIQRVYSMYPEHAQAYKDHLEQQAPLYGIDPAEVAGMDQPVLVREIDPPAEDATRIISLLNKTGTAALSPGERAISDSQRVSPETLERMQYEIEKLGEDGTLNKALAGDGGPAILERLVQDGLITERESPEYLTKENRLTPEAKTRIGRLMIGRFFGNVLQYEETPQMFRNKLEKIVAPLGNLEGRPEWDLFNQPIRDAIRIIHAAQARGVSKFEDLNAQEGLYGQTAYSPEAMAWAYALKNNSGKALGAAFRRFSELEGASRPGAPQDMFGPEPVSLQEAYTEAIAPLKAGKGSTIGKLFPQVAGREEPEMQSRRGSGSGSGLFDEGPEDLYAEEETPPAGREIARFANHEEGTYAAVTRTPDGYQVQLHDADDNAPLNQPVKRFSQGAAVAHAQDLAQQTGLVDKGAMRDSMERAKQDLAERERLSRPTFGMPSKPTRVKPAQQGGLFDEAPAQGGLELAEQTGPASYSAQFPASAPKKSYMEQENETMERAENEPDSYRAHLIRIRYDPDNLKSVAFNVGYSWQKWQKFAAEAAHRAKNPNKDIAEKAHITQRYADGSRRLFEEGKKYIAAKWGQEAADKAESDAREEWEAWEKEDKWGQHAADRAREAEWDKQRAEPSSEVEPSKSGTTGYVDGKRRYEIFKPKSGGRWDLVKFTDAGQMTRTYHRSFEDALAAANEQHPGLVWRGPREAAPSAAQPSVQPRQPEKRGAASARNIAIADLEAIAAQRGLTPEEQDELTGLRRQRAERMADRRTQFEREQAPLFAEQIPEAKPETFIQADEDRARGFRELNEKAEQRAQDYREAVAGAVTPEELAAMEKRWSDFWGPKRPSNKSSFWLERYRETFGKNPPDVSYVVSDAEGAREVYGAPWPRPRTPLEEQAKQAGLTDAEYLELKAPEGGGEEMQARAKDQAPPKRSVPEVQQILHDRGQRNAIKADAPDAVKLHRVKSVSRRELTVQLTKSANGGGWYADDTQLADNDLMRAFTELKRNPAKLILIKAISASTSASHMPHREANQVAYIYAVYREKGRIPLKNPANGKKWTGNGATVALVKIQRLLDHFGAKKDQEGAEKRLAEFLTTEHTAADIRVLGRKLGYTAGTVTDWIEARPRMMGAAVLGNKFSRYFAGITGIVMDGTPVDIWMARMHYRQLGTLLDAQGNPAENVRGIGDRRVFMQAHADLAKEFGLKPEAVQSLLWHHEQDLYRSLGAATVTAKRSDGTLKYLEDNGIAKTYTRGRRQPGGSSIEGAQSRTGGGAEPDHEGAVSGGAERGGKGRGSPETEGEVVARRPGSDPAQLNLFGEDSLTREQVDQAVQNPRPHIVSVDPSQYPSLPNPRIGDTPGTFKEYVINHALFRSGPSVGDVPVILVNDAGMDVLLITKGTWQGGANDGRTTAGIAIRPREWKTVLDAEIGALSRQISGRPLPLDDQIVVLAHMVRKALGMPPLRQQIQDAGGPRAPGVLRKVQGEWDHPVHSNKQFIVANSGYATGARLKEVIEEEYDHIQHMRLPGGFKTLPYQLTETHPLALKAAGHLEQIGYYRLVSASHPNQSDRVARNSVITSEILVRLMREGRYTQLGLNEQEKNDLALAYIQGLASHGSHAAVIIEQLRTYAVNQPTQEILSRNQPGAGQAGAPGEIVPRGPPGLAEGTGEDVSGLQDEEPETRALAPIRKAAERAAIAAKGSKVGRALGIGPTIERQVIPRIDDLEKATDQILYTFSPSGRGSAAEKAALSMRADTAHMDRVIKQVSIALEELRKPLGQLSQNQRWKFIIRSESNKPQTDATLPNGEVIPAAEMDRIAGVFNQVNDYIRKEVEDAEGPANQRIWRDVFWPNMWRETSNVKPGAARPMPAGLGRSPLAGPKSFEKKKVFDTFMDGVRAGYTPLYDNPVDYWQAKTREMTKFAMLTRLRADVKPLAKFKGFTEKMPDGYAKIEDPFTRIFQFSPKEKGFIARGDWVYPREAARIINNHLSPDPRQTMPLWKLVTDLGNLWLRWKLTGFYHFGATALNGIYSHAALAARMAASGDMKGAAEHLAKAPLSPVTDVMRGRRLHKQFLDINGTQTAAFKALEEGGFRAGQDPFYAAGMRQRFREAWRAGERIMPIKGLAAAMETITVPLMEHYVPYMKMAAAHDLARFELEQYQKKNAGMMPTPPRLRKMMADAVDSVDNRFGQLTYDNLFWNRMLKAALMTVVMSVGWNLGTVRELGGGIKDILTTGVGKGPGLSNKVAYLAALIALHTLGAGLYQKLSSGRNPNSVKDFVFPQDGGYDERGHATRVSFPDYMKELWNWTHDPLGSAINKSHPMLSMLFKYINNRDYWGSKIQNFEDDWKERVKQVFSSFIREEGLPLSGSNLSKMKERSGQPWGQFLKENAGKAAASQLGFSPTPAWISLTPAEKLLAEYMRERQPVGGRVVEEAQRTTARAAIVRAIRLGQDSQPAVENAMRQGLITGKDLARIHKAARFTPLQSAMGHDMLTPGEILHIWEAADPGERKQIEPFVKLRLARAANRPGAHWSDWARDAAQKQFGIKARSRLAIPPGSGLPPAVGASQ